MMGFCASPIDFINNLIESQVRDLKIMTSDSSKDEEEERHSRFYYQPFIYDAVQQYLQSLVTNFE